MSRWFRHYAGMMRDDKLVSVAIRAKQPVERVVWIWGAILESAAEIDDDGLFRLDCAEVAYFLRADEADISAVLAGLRDAGRVAENRVVRWGDRQFKSDRSAERQAKYRDKRREQVDHAHDPQTSGDDVVTAASRHGDAPETELDTDTENKNPPTPQGGGRDEVEREFEESVWPDFPRAKNSRRFAALKAYRRLKPAERVECIRGVARYSMRFDDDRADKRPMAERLRFVPHLSSWINQRGWETELETA